MPHLVILYTPQLDAEIRHDGAVPHAGRHACSRCTTKPASRSSRPAARACWPTRPRITPWPTGTAAATTPSPIFNLRMAQGRSAAVHKAVGEALARYVAKAHLRRCWRAATSADVADRRGRRGLRRQASATCIRCSRGRPYEHHARKSTIDAAGAPALRRAQVAHAAAPLLEAAPGHDHRRRLRDPARLGGARAGRRPHASRAARSA